MCGVFRDVGWVGRDEDRTPENESTLQNSARQKSGTRDLAGDLREGVKFELSFQWHLNIPGTGLGTLWGSPGQLGRGYGITTLWPWSLAPAREPRRPVLSSSAFFPPSLRTQASF